jgi:hypothetical protein
VRTLAVAVVLVCACDSGGNAPGGPTTGGIQFAWTIAGQPAAIGCGANSTVNIVSTTGPITVVQHSVACTDGHLLITDLVAGDYVFKATYVNPSTGAATSQEGVHATVVVGQISTADPIDFQIGQASLQVTWTVNGGMHCPSGAMVTVEAQENVMVLDGANMVGPIDVSCTFCP